MRQTVNTEADAREVFEMCGGVLVTSDSWFDRESLRIKWNDKKQLFLGTVTSTWHSGWGLYCLMAVKTGVSLLKYDAAYAANDAEYRKAHQEFMARFEAYGRGEWQ